MDSCRHVATLAGREPYLTAREFDLLLFLVRHTGVAFSRDQLLRDVSGWSFGDQSTVTVHVRWLRERRSSRTRRIPSGWSRSGRRLPLGACEMSDQAAAVLTAAAWSGTVGVAGLFVGWLLRRASPRWQPPAVALVAVAAFAAGVIGTAREMFLSDHDFHVVHLVLLVAGLVAFVFAMLVGATVVHWSRSLAEDARRFGESGHFNSAGGGPVEFQSVSSELTRTGERLAESRARETASRSPAASSSRGSPTTCAPRWPGCPR